ncbi:MAG TPA: hypothetical protein VHD14_00665 [Pseudolabrys sp.]|nr:hypothetical protein [Pseudolabrys sp.]
MIVAAAAILAMPFVAHAQQRPAPAPKKATNADAQRVVKAVSSDKTKMQAYCDLARITDQMDQADKAKDSKKMEELAKQADATAEKIGPEYASLMEGLQDVNENSPEGKAIGATLSGLDKQCPK